MYNRYIRPNDKRPDSANFEYCFDGRQSEGRKNTDRAKTSGLIPNLGNMLGGLRSLLPGNLDISDLLLIVILVLLLLEDEDDEILIILLFMMLGL